VTPSYELLNGPRATYKDPNLYFIRDGEDIVILLLYVDDMLISGSNSQLITKVQEQLCSKYRMKFGKYSTNLGVEFYTFSGGIVTHQTEYATKILADASMTNCTPVSIPLPVGTSLSVSTGTPPFDQTVYCHTVGQLLYLTNTRPDLSYAEGYVSCFMASPETAHW
jgi:hypothetical protein